MRRWMVILAAALAFGGCRKKVQEVVPLKPEQVVEELARAARANNPGRIFDLMDQKTRWSMISVYKNQRTACNMIRSYYPKARQSRELKRCLPALKIATARAFFAAWALKNRKDIIAPLTGVGKISSSEADGDHVLIESQGVRLKICKGGKGNTEAPWGYCGLRDRFTRMKIKSSRDLTSVKENVDTFRKGSGS